MDKIRAIVARERPDVLEIHSPYLAMAAGLSIARSDVGIRTFFWHADFIDTYLRVMLARHVSERAADAILAPLWLAVRALANACDATFVAGKAQADKLHAHGVARVVHVPFGVDKALFRPDARSDARRRELLGDDAPNGTRLLVGVGRFAVEKRWDVVLDAFVRVRDEAGVDAVLVLFGDGPERAAMETRVRGRTDVRFAGFEKDRARLASALASADLLVHGCPFETFGLGVAEAMSAGIPVVVPDRGGASESVVASASEVYRSEDVHACASAIVRILARDRDELRLASIAAGTNVASVEGHFDALLEWYRRLLRERRGTHAPK